MTMGPASQLQRGFIMMVRVVAILAAVALSGCGVGVDGEDPEGQAAMATSQGLQSGCTDPMLCPETPVAPRPPSPVAAQVPGTVALPQDPIPWRPTVTPTARPLNPGLLPEAGFPPVR